MFETSLGTGSEPSLGGDARPRLTGMEPGLGGSRRVKADPRLVLALLDDQSDEWTSTISHVLDSGLGRIYALELVKIVAAGNRRRRRGGVLVGYSTAQRIAATRALEALGEAVAVQALVDVLGDRAWWVGQYAIDALIAIGPPAADTVIEALENPDPIARRRAAVILGGIGDLGAVEPLTDVLNGDPVGWVRACAARGLGDLRARSSVEALRAAARGDRDQVVRQYARRALAQMGLPAEESDR
jgi:hypothetical protein